MDERGYDLVVFGSRFAAYEIGRTLADCGQRARQRRFSRLFAFGLREAELVDHGLGNMSEKTRQDAGAFLRGLTPRLASVAGEVRLVGSANPTLTIVALARRLAATQAG